MHTAFSSWTKMAGYDSNKKQCIIIIIIPFPLDNYTFFVVIVLQISLKYKSFIKKKSSWDFFICAIKVDNNQVFKGKNAYYIDFVLQIRKLNLFYNWRIRRASISVSIDVKKLHYC